MLKEWTGFASNNHTMESIRSPFWRLLVLVQVFKFSFKTFMLSLHALLAKVLKIPPMKISFLYPLKNQDEGEEKDWEVQKKN